MTDWLGNLPSWVSAIAASGALIFTSWTAYNSQRSARASEKQARLAAAQQRQRDEKDESEQASKIAAWLAVKQGNGLPTLQVHYVNSGPLPAYRLLVTPVQKPAFKLLIPVVEPTKGVRTVKLEHLSLTVQNRNRITASKSDETHLTRWFRWWTGWPSSNMYGMDVESAGVMMEFRDASGIVWRRAATGQLSKVESGLGASTFEAYLDALKSGANEGDIIEVAGTRTLLEAIHDRDTGNP